MITTRDPELCRRLRLFRNNGIERGSVSWHYEVKELTGNYNFTDIQAALGLSQLQRLELFVSKRRELVRLYRKHLAGRPHLRLFKDDYDSHTAFHLFVVQIDFAALDLTRTELMQRLMKRGVGSQLHYIPIYRHPFFTKKQGDISENFPRMEQYYAQALSLPLFYDMDEEDVLRVVRALEESLYLPSP